MAGWLSEKCLYGQRSIFYKKFKIENSFSHKRLALFERDRCSVGDRKLKEVKLESKGYGENVNYAESTKNKI